MLKETRKTALLVRWLDEGDQSRWHSTVENAYTGQKWQFSNKGELMHFLWQSLYGVETFDSPEDEDQESA